MSEEKLPGNKGEQKIIINKKNWGWPVAIIVIGTLGMMFIAGIFAWAFWGGYGPHGYRTGYSSHMMDDYGYRMMDGSGRWTGSNNLDRAIGTVTEVSGSNFTVAGGGSTTKIQTSGSTQYVYGNQVKVNDTVIVTGNTSGGVLQASRVVINP